MRGLFLILALLVPSAPGAFGVEEHVQGVLEKTVREGACAQLTDVLNDVYYVLKTPEAERALADLIGKKVVITGVVEQRGNDPAYYLSFRSATLYQPKSATKPPDTGSGPLPPPTPSAAPDEKK